MRNERTRRRHRRFPCSGRPDTGRSGAQAPKSAVWGLFLAGAGYFVVRRMIRPVAVLAEHLDRGRGGRMEPIAEAKFGRRHSEFDRLFRRYNALVEAVNQREELAAQLRGAHG